MSKQKTTRTFTMVGPRGVGKTSLLAAMYRELTATISTDFPGKVFLPDEETQTRVNDRIAELVQTTTGGFGVDQGVGITPSTDEMQYVFSLKSENHEIEFCFIDLPGGWYTNATPENYGRAIAQIKASPVTFLVVDAVALMEAPPSKNEVGKFHNIVNNVDAIRDIYLRTFQNVEGEEKRSIIITLVRAEKYIRDKRVDDMYQRLSESYGPFIDALRKSNSKLELSVFACYVQTVGTLFFNAYKEVPVADAAGNQTTRTVAKYVCPKQKYAPEGCSRPLRLAFSEMMRVVHQEAVDAVHSHEELVENIKRIEKEHEDALGQLVRLVEDAARDKEEYDNIIRRWGEFFWGKKSILAQKREELRKRLKDYDQAEERVKRVEDELNDAMKQLQLAGDVADELHAVIKNLKDNMNNNDFITL